MKRRPLVVASTSSVTWMTMPGLGGAAESEVDELLQLLLADQIGHDGLGPEDGLVDVEVLQGGQVVRAADHESRRAVQVLPGIQRRLAVDLGILERLNEK
jgi:hypothetical protein